MTRWAGTLGTPRPVSAGAARNLCAGAPLRRRRPSAAGIAVDHTPRRPGEPQNAAVTTATPHPPRSSARWSGELLGAVGLLALLPLGMLFSRTGDPGIL